MEKEKLSKKKKTTKKKNKKGFTLIELLAVIIILGIILLIAVPTVSKYIEESRQNTYVNAVKSIVTAVSTSVNALEYPIPNQGEAIIVPFSEANLEKEAAKIKSPYARYVNDRSYILVTFDGSNYNYYIAALDEAGYAIPLINSKDLNVESITTSPSTINNNIYSINSIYDSSKATQTLIDTTNITIRAYDKIGNIIKVKLCDPIYSTGNIIQLKDSSKWYVIQDSKEDSKTVTVVSYNHMDTSIYGRQSRSKTTPTKIFDTTGDVIYTEAEIYSTAEAIVAASQVQLIRNNINVTGATFSMPTLEDFSCSINSQWGTLSCLKTLSYLTNDESFWTKESYDTDVIAIKNRTAWRGSPNNYLGIRVVIRNLLKTNIDKDATKALN